MSSIRRQPIHGRRGNRAGLSVILFGMLAASPGMTLAQTVHVSRMWHNHQPIYWPEWNSNGAQTSRIQYAWDSIVLKNGQTYGTGSAHPDNNLSDIFSVADRVNAYQGGPRNSLANLSNTAGFCMSYSGSLIDNIRSLAGANQLGYGSGWWNGNREARNWLTPGGSRRMDLVGFTYHHSLAPLLPKSVFRKELQTFKQAWWKAWGGNSDLSDHSKGYFPTEMAFTSEMIDVLADEGYQWSIVASHHLSRTCPTYLDRANPTGSFQIKSSPPNKADLLGPSPTTGWWFNEPNPGQAAWNVSPHAYQLHRVKYVNPSSGAEKSIIAVPSDDVISYVAGYSGAQVGMISTNIAPFATDPNRPVMVLPATDGDNAWGGGSSSYFESTPAFFGACQSAGYAVTTVQDMVNSKPPPAGQYAHVEDGAWIFPESDYGSPYFLKWIEPPVGSATSPTRVPGTVIDLESPGFALKFWSWAPVITGANWCETAEQMLLDEGGSVQPWKIQAPYDWDGTWTNPNDVELAWHLYLGGLDSGFNYYGGLGNDDEVKPSLATRRAIEKLSPFVNARLANDRTPPSVLRPQRFPWNPGGHTFGWFNSIPGGNTSYLKKMGSEFYVWTHAYDVSGIQSTTLKVRLDLDGVNPMSDNQNETYAGGAGVGSWISIPMTKRILPKTRTELNAAANNGQIDYFITPPELADYYFAKITEANVAGFRGRLLDYHIESTDTRGNTSRSEIQHVFVEDDGGGGSVSAPATPTQLVATVTGTTTLSLTWTASSGATGYQVFRNGSLIGSPSGAAWLDTGLAPGTTYSYTVAAINSGGASAQTAAIQATTQSAGGTVSAPFVMDGVADSGGYLISNPGMTIHAAVRGSKLYVATWAPGQFGNDHFILIGSSALTSATTAAPWAKAGSTSLPANSPFLAAESSNSYIGWFNANGAATTEARGAAGQQMEGTIDLAAFGTTPASLHLTALAYQTADAGLLGSQAPAGNADGNVDPAELLGIPLEALRDEDANGTFDILEPNRGFAISQSSRNGNSFSLTWTSFPGRSYKVQTSTTLASGSWTDVAGSTTIGTSNALTSSHVVTLDPTDTQRFFRVMLMP